MTMQATLFDTGLDELVALGGSRGLYERALALLSDEWARWGVSPLTHGDDENLYVALVDLAEAGIVEERFEQIEQYGQPAGFRTHFRKRGRD